MTATEEKFSALRKAISKLEALLSPCKLCPRHCLAKRSEGERGVCELDGRLKVFCCNLHFGEEPPLSGTGLKEGVPAKGSGTVFFSGCNLRCVYCQNFAFSHLGNGRYMTEEELAGEMLKLQKRGAKNINFVTPTPQILPALKALLLAYEKGLRLPLLYNCGGYEDLEVLKALEGVVDIYLPDAKYQDSSLAAKYSAAPDYPEKNITALREMWRQTQNFAYDEDGYMTKGMIVRHLVLPGAVENSLSVLDKLKEEFADDTGKAPFGLSLMCQYFPTFKAKSYPELKDRLTFDEYLKALEKLDEMDFELEFVQQHDDCAEDF
ncbi:radical SAM protein [bacterium]|nr:radical SAM protein [bacterium]